jgi:perosamine synthetase
MSTLALFGGTPEIKAPLAPYNRIGSAERKAVLETLKGGVLSGYIGAPGPGFDGGPKVQELETRWADTFHCAHAIAVNSATSGLFAALGACNVGPGDEVIVPPYTMSATAVAPFVYGGLPVFVDIEPETFCLDIERVREAITDRTKAIIAVNLFGHPARLTELRSLADDRDIYLVEDNAQAPLASENGVLAGTIGHIGVFSLNRHKHIQTGEGGVCTTDNSDLALRLKLIRNHGENLVEHYDASGTQDLVGFNYRLTELSAAVGVAQLQRAAEIVNEREALGHRLSAAVAGLPGLTPPQARAGCRHTFYAWPLRYDADKVGVPRGPFLQAMAAEGVPLNGGYVAPLYRLPIFKARNSRKGPSECPVTERMYESEEVGFGICEFELSDTLIDQIAVTFHKVYENRAKLKGLSKLS